MDLSFLEKLKPAEAGLMIDGAVGCDEVYATFSDLMVRGRIDAVGHVGDKKFVWDGRTSDLNEFESIVILHCFEPHAPVAKKVVEDKLNAINLENFNNAVITRSVRIGLYDIPEETLLYYLINRLYFEKNFEKRFNLLFKLSLLFPVGIASFFIVPLIFAVLTVAALFAGSAQLMQSVWAISFSLMSFASLFLVVGMLAGFVLLLELAKKLVEINPKFNFAELPVSLQLKGMALFFILGHAGIAYVLYNELKNKRVGLDLDKFISEDGERQKKKYLELKAFLGGFQRSKVRVAYEFEPYAIAFGLRNREISAY